MGVQAGRLPHKIEILEVVEHLGQDGTVNVDDEGQPLIDDEGQPTRELKSKGYAFAGVTPVRGNEKMRWGREQTAVMINNFKLRFRGELRVSDKLRFNGYLWDIVSIAPMGRQNREVLEVTAEVRDVRAVVETDGE